MSVARTVIVPDPDVKSPPYHRPGLDLHRPVGAQRRRGPLARPGRGRQGQDGQDGRGDDGGAPSHPPVLRTSSHRTPMTTVDTGKPTSHTSR